MGKLVCGANLTSYLLAFIIAFLSVNGLEPQGEYHYLELALNWPYTYCKTAPRCSKEAPNWFTIGSLDPMYKPRTEVPPFDRIRSQCHIHMNESPPAKLLEEHLQGGGLIEQLEMYWPNLHGRNFNYWDNKWFRQGRCFNFPLIPRFYFVAALSLRMKDDIQAILLQGGIAATRKKHSISKIVSAIEGTLQVKVRLICLVTALNGYQLMEIGMCFDRDGQRINCEQTVDTVWTSGRDGKEVDEDDCRSAPDGMVTF